jgi:hypothetical protein
MPTYVQHLLLDEGYADVGPQQVVVIERAKPVPPDESERFAARVFIWDAGALTDEDPWPGLPTEDAIAVLEDDGQVFPVTSRVYFRGPVRVTRTQTPP